MNKLSIFRIALSAAVIVLGAIANAGDGSSPSDGGYTGYDGGYNGYYGGGYVAYDTSVQSQYASYVGAANDNGMGTGGLSGMFDPQQNVIGGNILGGGYGLIGDWGAMVGPGVPGAVNGPNNAANTNYPEPGN